MNHQGPVYYPHKGPAIRKAFPFHGVIMACKIYEHVWFSCNLSEGSVVLKCMPLMHTRYLKIHKYTPMWSPGFYRELTKNNLQPCRHNNPVIVSGYSQTVSNDTPILWVWVCFDVIKMQMFREVSVCVCVCVCADYFWNWVHLNAPVLCLKTFPCWGIIPLTHILPLITTSWPNMTRKRATVTWN